MLCVVFLNMPLFLVSPCLKLNYSVFLQVRACRPMVLVDGGAVRDQLVVAARSNMLCCGGRKVSIRDPVSCVPLCVFTCVKRIYLGLPRHLGARGKAGTQE